MTLPDRIADVPARLTRPLLFAMLLLLSSGCSGDGPKLIERERGRREAAVFRLLESRGMPDRVNQLFRQVPQELFLGPESKGGSYGDHPVEIGVQRVIYGMPELARLIAFADIGQFHDILLIGSMGGYLESLIRIVPAFVTVVDADCAYLKRSERAYRRYESAASLKSRGGVRFHCADPMTLNAVPESAGESGRPGFDRVIVPFTADWLPKVWLDAIRPSGRIVVVSGTQNFGRVMIGNLQSTGLTWRQGPDTRLPRLDNRHPQNLYGQFAGDLTEPLIWPEFVQPVADPKPDGGADAEPAGSGTGSDDAANERDSGLKEVVPGRRGSLLDKNADPLGGAMPEEEPLRLSIAPPPAIRAGGKALVEIAFERSSELIKVPQYPSAYLLTDPAPGIGLGEERFRVRDISREDADAKGLGISYYEDIPSLRANIPVASEVKPGRYPVSGTVFYFYCSTEDDAGYCAIHRQPVSFAVEVAK